MTSDISIEDLGVWYSMRGMRGWEDAACAVIGLSGVCCCMGEVKLHRYFVCSSISRKALPGTSFVYKPVLLSLPFFVRNNVKCVPIC